MNTYDTLIRYVADALKTEEHRIAVALGAIDRYRCPLEQADGFLASIVWEAVKDFEADTDTPDALEFFDTDIETLFYESLNRF